MEDVSKQIDLRSTPTEWLIKKPPNVPKTNSPAFDESVLGFAGDKHLTRFEELEKIREVAGHLEKANIPCCVVGEWALIYYGAGRTTSEWILCVPSEHHRSAVDILRTHAAEYMPFQPSALKGVNSLNHTYPRFKGIGIRFFFLVVPSQEPNITCSPANIERSKSGVPFVNLPTYAQSLIDTQNTVDLEDLVDGMDLSLEWGEENLDLEGSTDTSWAQARIDALLADGTKKMFVWIDAEPHSRRAIWERMVGGKTRRMGFKYPEELYLTRFRRRGSRDPRKWNRDL